MANEKMKLTRAMIGQTALDVAATEGAQAVSLRRVALRLGCAAMSLYTHVDSYTDLLLASVESRWPDRPRVLEELDGLRRDITGIEVAQRVGVVEAAAMLLISAPSDVPAEWALRMLTLIEEGVDGVW